MSRDLAVDASRVKRGNGNPILKTSNWPIVQTKIVSPLSKNIIV